MKIAIITAAALTLGACSSLTAGGATGQSFANAAIEIAKDPACSHTDVLDVMLGPVPSGHIHLERSNCKTGDQPSKVTATPEPGPAAPPTNP